jgi:hypothetical protein
LPVWLQPIFYKTLNQNIYNHAFQIHQIMTWELRAYLTSAKSNDHNIFPTSHPFHNNLQLDVTNEFHPVLKN